MGYSLSWVAVKGKSVEEVLKALGLKHTGVYEEISESQYTGAQLPGGRYQVISNRGEDLACDKALGLVSAGCEVIAGFVEEHVMVSSAALWKDGKMVWSVVHDAQQGIEHLKAEGALPPEFAFIRDAKTTAQQADGGREAGVDHIFDVPVDLAEALTGYRYDKDISGAGEKPFEVLEPLVKKSWLGRLLGR
jgi:hypothetical protein